MYKVRVILDTEEDVIRTVSISGQKSLEDLHFLVARAFGFDGQEMASFYRADASWNQGEEIPLFSMAEAGEGLSMRTCGIAETLPNPADKLIYVYDFLHMWTFYIELIEISEEEGEEKIILSVGNVPEDIPEKEFKAEDIFEDFNDNNTFENLDDFDLDNF